jgi:hypothetical protein
VVTTLILSLWAFVTEKIPQQSIVAAASFKAACLISINFYVVVKKNLLS